MSRLDQVEMSQVGRSGLRVLRCACIRGHRQASAQAQETGSLPPVFLMTVPSLRALAPMLLTEVARPFTRDGWNIRA